MPAIIKNLLRARSDAALLGPLAARSVLLGRDQAEPPRDPAAGTIHPQDINNNAVFAIFGLIGAGFVIVGIWFFFWAKNGGFYFKKGDWEDYKSTVLRRKGPNGTVYSNATPSTVLGGGSVYKDVEDGTTTTGDDLTTVVSATTGITGITGGVSDISGREKRRRKREQKEREKERRREEKAREKEQRKKSRRKVDADGIVVDEEAEAKAKEQLRSYRHEKPARVGGMNREAEGSSWDGSTNPTWSTASPSQAGAAPSTVDTGSDVTSDLISNRQSTPTNTPTKKDGKERTGGGIRKVYSTADKNAMRENERIRAEARRLQEKGRAAAAAASSSALAPIRRDFSFIRGADDTMALRRIDEVPTESVVSGATNTTTDDAAEKQRARSRSRHRSAAPSDSRVPGSWAESEAGGSDLGTKVYRHSHHIPTAASSVTGTSVTDFAYAEEKRKKRGGAGARRHRDRGGEEERAA
ncbi:354d0020-8b0e-463a-bb6f-53ad1c615e56 [Thermothielavioides terrestris]|jgi:hypothetical protein|uniref:Endosomal spry domain-containing protein n=2 Tax=Thermothielavioides terrestris TaxID=2587410 RepID=G2QXW0_THETT|nr:uncharacterized protein THITE_2108171 [Thermothielavioides terrestris NRRL 8126]AEO63228.1 hypothetical protein THITE_2108171 [Thermothielavioides terrestris NRRL 8126]SPQ21283.1 354d0020-8b0e-463a-bb6f-53ad1c615e56 [Thermothielavioides terrestris]